MNNKSRSSLGVLVAITLLSATLGLMRFNSLQVGAIIDDAHYVVLAESIAGGQGFHLINFPDAPAEWAFPPGWPLLLSPFAALLPGNYSEWKLLSFIFWIASIPLAYRLFAPRLETPYREMLIALIALNPMLDISGSLMSEAAFLFFVLLALYVFDYWETHGYNDGWLVVAVALAVYSEVIRTIGVSVLLAFILCLVFLRRFRQLGITVVVILLGAIPQLWLNSQSGGLLVSSGYQSEIFGSSPIAKLGEILWNLQSYANEMIANRLVPVFGPNMTAAFNRFGLGMVLPLLNVLILVTIGFGAILSFRQFRLGGLFVGLYFMGILTLWTTNVSSAQPRYLIPLVPFLYFYLLQALLWFAHRVPIINAKRVPALVLGLASLIILFSVTRNIQDWRDPARNRMIDLSIGTVWIREHTPQQSVVMVSDPVPDYLYARRKTVAYPTEGQDIARAIAVSRIDYVMVSPKLETVKTNELDDFTETRLLPFLESNPDRFRRVDADTFNNVAVYQVRNP